MRILQVASEAVPLCKTGGLADVVSALSRALCQAGDDVRLVMPAYAGVREAAGARLWLDLGDPLHCGPTSVWRGRLPGTEVPVWLVVCEPLYRHGDNPYLDEHGHDHADNAMRFALLAWVAAWLARHCGALGWPVDVVHCHDWQAGLVPAYLHWSGGARPRTVQTVHNLHFAGRFGPQCLPNIAAPAGAFSPDGIEFYGMVSYLKAGLYYADQVTTVSPTYAAEISTPAGGEGFDGLWRARAGAAHGILNGVDEQIWDPRTDPLLPIRYDIDRLDIKLELKRALQAEVGLDTDAQGFLLGLVGRLTWQKGIDLVLGVLPQIRALGGQLLVLGSGESGLEVALRSAAHQDPGSVAFRRGYDEGLSHRILAACDAALVPSRFEPCGLTQLYAQRYGTPPIVRFTGGLADTVVDDDADPQGGTGFVFGPPSTYALAEAIGRAAAARQSPKRWRQLQSRGMAKDFGWSRGAQAYRQVYRTALAKEPSPWPR